MNNHLIEQLKHSRVDNYAGVPGLTSWMLYKAEKGCVRLFEMFREQEQHVTPHSHRFDFSCIVLEGSVQNTLYVPASIFDGDEYIVSEMHYENMGEYRKEIEGLPQAFAKRTTSYFKGSEYGMKAEDIHSITFSKGARVLFFEGDMIRTSNLILEPYVYNEHIETFKVEDWMFKKR